MSCFEPEVRAIPLADPRFAAGLSSADLLAACLLLADQQAVPVVVAGTDAPWLDVLGTQTTDHSPDVY